MDWIGLEVSFDKCLRYSYWEYCYYFEVVFVG